MRKLVLFVLMALACSTAYAGFGGGRSSGSFSSSRSFSSPSYRSSSSFGGSRASSSATISRPSYSAPSRSATATQGSTHTTTVINNGSNGGGGGGFWTGMMMGNMLSHPAPVIVTDGQAQVSAAPVVVQQGMGFGTFVFWLLICVVVVGVVVVAFND